MTPLACSKERSLTKYEEEILRSLRRITRAIDIHSRRLAQAHRLTGPQLVCLRQIHKDVETTPSALARQISLSQATVTGILDRLASRGLLVRVRSETDRRRVMLTLTEAGRAVAESAPSPLQQRFAERLGALPADGQAQIAAVLQQIVTMMEADAIKASPILATGASLDEDE